MNYTPFVLACLFLVGCNSLKQEVDPRGLSNEPEKIVVACFISPQDTVLAARIGRSSTILGPDNRAVPDIPNAIVTMSDGTRSVVLKKAIDEVLGYTYYRAKPEQLPVIVGKTYTLMVSVPNGQTIDASCTVPGPVAIESIRLDSNLTQLYSFVRMEYYARLRWRDSAGQANYYRVAGQNEYSYRAQVRTTPNGPLRDSLVQVRGNWSFNTSPLLTDIGRDGEEFVSPQGRLANTTPRSNGGASSIDRPRGYISAYLLNVDESYYHYHDEVARQSKVRNNPFAEPVLIQTNVRGGLGCFGAYNKSTLVIQLK